MEIIRVRNLDVGYGRTVVLRGLNFSIDKGRITVIIGESGSGKSTLLKTLIGLMPPARGRGPPGRGADRFRLRARPA